MNHILLDKIMLVLMLLATVLLILTIWQTDLRDWRLLHSKGKAMYHFKELKLGANKIWVLYIVFILLYGYDYLTEREPYQLWALLFWGILMLLFLTRGIRKNALYENLLVIEKGCYTKEEIKTYAWQNEYLILQVPSHVLFEGKKLMTVKAKVDLQEREKVELILQGYGIKKETAGNNIANA